jgi:hypothetical protein
MPHFICITCGTQFAAGDVPPRACRICEDERQYVNAHGQQWTEVGTLAQSHRNIIKPLETRLYGIGTEPSFAIGQRALLVVRPEGNILWDCINLIDPATVSAIKALGGISAIAISHPHYYASMVEWSYAFGNAPIHLHAADRAWVMRPDRVIRFWKGDTLDLGGGVTLICCGGHFAGGTVLHWPAGADGRGVLLSGDILQVCADRRHVSFMYSYPNYIPLAGALVERVVQAVEPFAFDRIYGAWWDRVIAANAKQAVAFSRERYLRAIGFSA